MSCFLFHWTEDGDQYITQFNPEDITKVLEDHGNPTILREIPERADYAIGALVIQGRIVIPKAVEVVQKYEIPAEHGGF